MSNEEIKGKGISPEDASRLSKLRRRDSAKGLAKDMVEAMVQTGLAEVKKVGDGEEIIKAISKKGATPAESEKAQKIIQESGAEAQQLQNSFVDSVKSIAEENGKIKKTADDFTNDLSAISTKKELLEYLNTLDSVNTGSREEGVIYFPGYLEKVKNVLAGKSNWNEIGVKSLKEKVKELLKKPKTDKKSDKIGNKEWFKQALSQNVDFFKEAISGISDIDAINGKVKEYEDLYKGTNDAADFLGKIRIIADGKINEIVEKQKKKESQKITDETALRTEQLKADFINSLKEIADERDRLEPISPEATVFQLEKKAKGLELKKEEMKKLGDEVRLEVETANKKIEERKNKRNTDWQEEGKAPSVSGREAESVLVRGGTKKENDKEIPSSLEAVMERMGGNKQDKEKDKELKTVPEIISAEGKTFLEKQRAEAIGKAGNKEIEKQTDLEKNIAGSESFEDLLKVIETSGGIQGSQEFFDVDNLKNIINKVKNGDSDITAVTRTGGLRQKVGSLLALERPKTENEIKLEELRKKEAEIKDRLIGIGAVHIAQVHEDLEAVQRQIKDIQERGSESEGKKEDIKKKIIGLDKAVLTGLIKFNFKKEDLENIASFVGLDKPQQLFALAGLNQAILEKAKIDALEAYNIKSKEGGWMKKAFTGLTKNYQISNLEKELAQKITKGEGGYKQYLKMSLGSLSEIAGNIPDMVEKEGKIEVAYIKKDDFGNLPPHADSKLDELNQVFNQFSKIPQEWSLDTASKDEKKQYRTMAKKYEKAKKEVLQLKSIANNETEAMAYLSGVEGQAKLHQLFNTHPDAEKALAEMSSNKNWMKALKNVVVERGGYAAAGYALRSYTMATVGMVGLPIAAAVMGGWMGRKRAQSSLRERELLSKHGREGEQSKEDRNIVKAAGLISKIKLLENKIKNESDDGKRAKLTDSLKVRIQYTEDKLTKGLVDYGANEARIGNKYDLFQKLNYAKNLEMVSGGYGERGNRLLSRLNEYLSDKEGKINKARSKYLRDKMINGAVFGAAFAVGGYAIRHFAGEWYSGNNNNTDVANKAPVSNENIPGKIEPVEPAIEPVAAVPTIKIGDVVMEAPSNPLAIGKRGPEGAVIDYLESKGMESEKAGSKAHKMFLEWAGSDEGKEFLSAKLPDGDINNPEYVDEAMRHISEGEVEITPEGKMRIVEAKFLDFNAEEGDEVISGREELVLEEEGTGEQKGSEYAIAPAGETGLSEAKFTPAKELENARNFFKASKTFDSAERANIGKMTIGKLLAETTEAKIDKVQGSSGTEGVIDLPPARAQLSEAEYGRYVQLAKQIRNAKLDPKETKMTVDDFFKLGDEGIKRIFVRARTR